MCGKEQERDELRARFTKWMEVLAYRTRRKYLDARNQVEQFSLEDIPPERLAFKDEQALQSDSFDFEEQHLADALTSLPDQKRQILTMLYVLEMKPEEIAAKLNCTIQNVYNQRSLTLKRLRAVLGGGEGHE